MSKITFENVNEFVDLCDISAPHNRCYICSRRVPIVPVCYGISNNLYCYGNYICQDRTICLQCTGLEPLPNQKIIHQLKNYRSNYITTCLLKFADQYQLCLPMSIINYINKLDQEVLNVDRFLP